MRRTFLLLILLTACSQGPEDFVQYTGTDGIVFDFAENSPPDSIYEKMTMPVKIHVANRGADDVDYDEFLLTFSWDPLYFEGGRVQFEPDEAEVLSPGDLSEKVLRGKSLAWPSGQDKLYQIPAAHALVSKEVIGTREYPRTSVTAGVCYEYTTVFSSMVCIDTSVFEANERQQVCEQGKHSFSGGQGAPVEVTSLEVENFPVVDDVLQEEVIRPSFTLKIRNSGSGRVAGPDGLTMQTACLLLDIPSENVGAVRVEAWLLNAELECQPNPVRLFGDEGETRCSVPVEELSSSIFRAKQNFQTTFVAHISYLYVDHITAPVEIVRLQDPDLTEPIKGQVPGYVYEGGQIVTNEDGSPKTVCERDYSGWDCGCGRTECLRIAARTSDDLGCLMKTGICPEPTFCCGPEYQEPEDPTEIEPA